MTRYIVSIDQGTTSSRAIVFDQKGEVMGNCQKEFTQHFPKPGWVEHDAEEILNSQVECIKGAVKEAGISGDQVAAVGISNQRETSVVWDRESGKPVSNAIVWQCRRTQALAEELKKDESFRNKTGLVPDAYFSGPKVKWILDNVDGARQQAEAGKLAFGTIDSWLVRRLTKEKNHLSEPSNASRTMIFNIHENDWDDELLRKLDVPRSMMPRIVPSNSNFGTTDKDLVGFEAPICGILGDQQAALFGQACFKPGMSKCTYGTGSFLLTNIGTKAKLTDGLLTTIAWQLEGEELVYAFEGAIFVAGAAIQWLRDGLGIIESSDQTEKLATSIVSNEGVYFVPALVGLGSPWWDSDVRGTIVGLTRGSKREHLVRAALESMAYQVGDVSVNMNQHGIGISELRVDGGATRNGFMLQFQADILGVPVVRAKQIESTAWGVAALSGLKAGVFESLEQLNEQWQSDLRLQPQTDRKVDYEGWQKALAGAFACAAAPDKSKVECAKK
ncbi:MAG: glycerol kinase GlpK [Cyanobacteria bacterium]|nr:glycerol kinase GlpK [Cyanobacteriota bacterium]